MQLREIHIDGFGIFRDRHLTGLSAGLNTIYGPNEFGKSTLLAFIRRILFGFPTRSSRANPYPALSGGAYGGRLKCELPSGEIITIARKQGTHGGPVTIITDSTELTGDEALRKLLGGNISSTFYESVYAIGLNELEKISSLETSEIKEHLYSASLGLGDVTLKQIKDIFIEESANIFKTSGLGSNQKIPETYKKIKELEKNISEMQEKLSEYDTLVQQQDELKHEVGLLDSKIKEYQDFVLSLEKKQQLFPVYIELYRNKTILAELPESPDFAPDSLSRLEQLNNKAAELQERIEAETGNLEELRENYNRLNYNEQVLALEANIIDMQKKSEYYKSAKNDIKQLISDRYSLKNAIGKEIEKIGSNWTYESIRKFGTSYLQKEKLDSFKQRFIEIKKKIDSSNDKLDYHREKKASEFPSLFVRFTGRAFYKVAIYIIAALGLAGIIIGIILSQILATIFPAIFLIIAVGLIIYIRKKERGILYDGLEWKFEEDLKSARSDEENLNREWDEFLANINFPAGITPDGANDIINSIDRIQKDIDKLDDLDNRISKMQQTIEAVKEIHDEISKNIEKLLLSGDIETDIEIFNQQLSSAKKAKQEKESLEKQIEKLIREISSLNEKKDTTGEECKKLFASYNTADEQDFRLKFETFKKREELKDTINNRETTIQTITGTGDKYDDFLKSLSATSEEEIISQLNFARSELQSLEEERDPKREQIGGLKERVEQIEKISHSNDLLTGQEELEINKQQLRDHSHDWVKAQIALFILEKAASKYEDTRQPAVIEAASGIFASITGGAYPKIIRPLESDEFTIHDKNDTRKSINQMSRGTMEQLFLALRLGLIKVYEDEAEPMPIVMDDILVNFDDTRGPLAIKTLAEFAKNRQIIILTCHKNMLETYKKSGIREITFS